MNLAAGRVMVVGDVFCDVILRGARRLPAWGEEIFADEPVMCPGGAANVAVGLARLGVDTVLLARSGARDAIGAVIADELAQQADLTTHWLQPAPSTALTVALPHGSERALISYISPAPGRAIASLLPWAELDRVSHLHLGGWNEGPSPSDDQAEVLTAARQRGITTSLDVSLEDDASRAQQIRELMGSVDLFIPNRAEACWIAAIADVEQALHRLGRLVRTVVIKLGAEGAIGLRDGLVSAVPAPAVDVVDTTGAGDAFAAGFLYGHMRRWPLRRCLQLANICGAWSVSRPGSSISGPTRSEAFTTLERHVRTDSERQSPPGWREGRSA